MDSETALLINLEACERFFAALRMTIRGVVILSAAKNLCPTLGDLNN
jgi:hypothetical protein